jgi:CDP-diacylglycerol--glycerol-3-phosphate 3-phosphatidyltransferase
VKSIPNLLSLARLAAAPYLFLVLWHRQWSSALAVIVFAAVTDFLDGFLARRWQVNSAFGEALDPIADKALLSGAFVALWLAGSIEGWLAGVVLGRDALILLFAGVVLLVSKDRRRFPPSQLGKISTGMQIALVIAIAMQVPAAIIEILKWATVALTAGSGIDYAGTALGLTQRR